MGTKWSWPFIRKGAAAEDRQENNFEPMGKDMK